MLQESLWRKASRGVRVADDTLMKGLLTLWCEGWRVYSVQMKHEVSAGPGGNVTVDGGLVDPGGHSTAEQSVRALSGSARAQALNHSPHPMHARMSRPAHDPRPPGQNLSTANAIHDRPDPANEQCTPVATAFARRHPQITHAPATSCPMYTCAHQSRR